MTDSRLTVCELDELKLSVEKGLSGAVFPDVWLEVIAAARASIESRGDATTVYPYHRKHADLLLNLMRRYPACEDAADRADMAFDLELVAQHLAQLESAGKLPVPSAPSQPAESMAGWRLLSDGSPPSGSLVVAIVPGAKPVVDWVDGSWLGPDGTLVFELPSPPKVTP